ncbi:putative secreted protein (Por secretion system target) [Maribacter vaceletii]|uniref:Putative secreted protein (Por secretion system target) n=1 Tax=Maribacter vaceletii TaxID=1206816 RepID=A0A495E9E3_9FLAO|nr:T9SS type A sorting domain-containing protein [Maribacter vaceletii]RKR13301.1 putative secreted protein (Por secretion system target) [Maribacter vaceletii]
MKIATKIILFLTIVFFQFSARAQTDPDFFNKIKTERVVSDPDIEWESFAPGTSGYCEEFWCHPTDTNVMFSGPDMHASFGTWDGGLTWQTLKDYDGSGLEMRRVIDIQFSTQNPDLGIAFSSNQTSSNTRGEIYETNDRGKTWSSVSNMGLVHSKVAIHPTNDNIWFLGAGDFWNVKAVRRSQANPNGGKQSRASYGYVWKTTDKGANWTKVATNLSNDLDVGRIIFNPSSPQNMIMATSHGVYVSSDTGDTWTANSTGLPNNLPRDLTSHYESSTGTFTLFLVEQTVFTASGSAINSTGGVYKSTDNGASWTSITGDLGIDFTTVTDWSARNRYHRSLGYWFGMSINDSKATHTTYPSNVLSVFNRIVVNPLNKDEIYISQNTKHDYGFGPGDIWKTENGGTTWFPCARNGKYWLNNSNASYWNNKTGLSTTTANMDFSHVQTEMDDLSEIQGTRALAINANGDVFTVIAQQTFRTNNSGNSWEQIDDFETNSGSNKWVGRGNNALPGRFMLLETGIQNRKLLCSGEHGLWQTTDLDGWANPDAVVIEQIEGQTFDTGGYKSAHSISAVAVHPNDPNTIYTLVDRQTHRGKVRKSTDGGQTWSNIATIFDAASGISSSVAHQRSLLIDPVTPNNMYFVAVNRNVRGVGGSGPGPTLTQGQYGVYRSNDGGVTWNVNNPSPLSNTSVSEIAMHPDDPQTIFATLNHPVGALYKSVDGAVSWTPMTIPSEIASVNDIFIDRNTKDMFLSAGSRSGVFNAGGVWKSTDDGATWDRIFEAPFIWQTETSPLDSNIILISAATQIYTKANDFKNPGAYLSLDGGTAWTKINKGLAHSDRIVDLKPDPYDQNIIWSAGWGSGWYKAQISTVEKTVFDADFTIAITTETCPNQNNGKINIVANSSNDYIVSFNGTTTDFTKDITLENIEPGNYNLCISIDGKTESQCFNIEIKEAAEIQGISLLSEHKFSLNIEKGTAPFSVSINDQVVYETLSNSFSVDVNHGDVVKVKSGVLCEGTIVKSIDLLHTTIAYPNPTNNAFQLSLPMNEGNISIELYNINSQLVSSKVYKIQSGKVNLNLENNPAGIYFVKIKGKKPTYFQIIKN